MAKKDLNFDFDDDFDFDYEDSPTANDRKPSSKIVKSLKENAAFRANDAKFQRELLKASLPEEYTSVLDDYDTISKEAGSIWRQQEKEWAKHRSGIKRMLKPYADVLGSVGFKKLKSWAEEEDRQRSELPNQEQMDELKVQEILSDTFSKYSQQQSQVATQLETARQEKEDGREADTILDREATTKRGIITNQYLESINKNSTALKDYNDQVNLPYQRRSLEIQSRMLITSQRSLTAMLAFRDASLKELQAIHKNSALPDYLKITPAEMTRQAIANRITGAIAAPFDNIGPRLASRIGNRVRTKMADWWTFLGDRVSDANSFGQDASDEGGNAASALRRMLGDGVMGTAVDWGSNKIAGRITPKIREMLERNQRIKKLGAGLRSSGGQFAGLLNESMQSGETGNKLLDWLFDATDMREEAITSNHTLRNNRGFDLDRAVQMTERFSLSITDVIPAWLKKIFGEVYAANNNGKKPKDQIWDFKQSEFTDTATVQTREMNNLIDKEKVKEHVKAVDTWVQIIGQDALSPETRDFVKQWVTKQYLASRAINPFKLLAENLQAPWGIKEELLFILPKTLKLNDEQVRLVASGTMTDILAATMKGSADSNNVVNKLNLAAKDVGKSEILDYKRLAELSGTPEGRAVLKRSGFGDMDTEGTLKLNEGRVRELLEQFTTVRKHATRPTLGRFTNRKVEDDGSIGDELRDLDAEGYDDAEVIQRGNVKNHMSNMGDFYLGERGKLHKEIVAKVKSYANPDSPYNPGYGHDYFINKQGKIVTRAMRNFAALRKAQRPDVERFIVRGFAAGGRIQSLASGGMSLKSGITGGEPSNEQTVKTHGGEFVVSNDATKTNVKLLELINKYGAPFINADGTINSVYHKAFGFKTSKEFDLQAKAKGLTNRANDVKNEQMEILIKNILVKLDPRHHSGADLQQLTNKKGTTERRLATALKMWQTQQRAMVKQDPAGYAKSLGSQGYKFASGKFNNWLDSDGTGVNLEIRDKLMQGFMNTGSGLAGASRQGMNRLRASARQERLDRDATLTGVGTALANAENAKSHTALLDLYFNGMGSPFVTKQGFKKGLYIDKQTGAIIRNPSEITGTIVDKEGNEIVSVADMATNAVVTRSGKPYKLLGMDEGIRKYVTTKEYISERYSLITGSEKFKQLAEQAKAANARFIMDKPVDVYLRGETEPKLRAVSFKAGEYTDVNSGNVLWSHHDITGSVKDKNGDVVLTEEELKDGLFDSKQEHLKISKIKAVRNNTFRRGHEMYSKYASKHVKKLSGAGLNWMSKVGEKQLGMNFDGKPIDVYVAGETSPRIRAFEFKNGSVICDGKPIKSHSGIKGVVSLMSSGIPSLAISAEELSKLVDANGEKLDLPLMMSAGQRFKEYLKEAALPRKTFGRVRDFINLSPEKRMEKLHKEINDAKIAFDVYVKGANDKPVLTKAGFERGDYFSAHTGKAVLVPAMIDGAVIDAVGSILLTKEEMAKGLVTFDGKEVKIGLGFGASLLGNARTTAGLLGSVSKAKISRLRTTAKDFQDIYLGKGSSSPILKAADLKAGKYFSAKSRKAITTYQHILEGVVDGEGKVIVSEDDLKAGLFTSEGVPIGMMSLGSRLKTGAANLLRKGSWLWQRQEKEKKDKDGNPVKEDKKEKKGSWIGALVKRFMLPLGVMFGGLASGLGTIKSVIAGSIAWLAKSMITKSLGGGLGSVLGGLLGGGRGRGGMLGTVGKMALAGGAVYGGMKAYDYLDGSGNKSGGAQAISDPANMSGMLNSQAALGQQQQGGEGGSFLGDLMGNPYAMAALAAGSMIPGAWKAPFKLAGWAGKKAVKGTLAATGAIQKGLGMGAGAAARGAARAAPSAARGGLGLLGRLGSGAGKLLGGSAAMTGGIGRAALGVGGMAFSALRLLTGPIGIGLTVAWYGGKAALKLWNNHKNPWNRFRMAQYGFNHNNKAVLEKIAKIEAAAMPMIKVSDKGASLVDNEEAMKTILGIVGIYDEKGNPIEAQQPRLSKFALWFKERFLRVYGSYLISLKKLRGKAEMIDLQTLNRPEQEILFKDVHFTNAGDTPYMHFASPFEDPAEATMRTDDVNKIAVKLKNKIAQLPEVKDYKVPEADNKDGLGTDKLAPLPENATPEQKLRHDLDKKALEGGAGKKDSPNVAIDDAVKAVNYQAKASAMTAKFHNQQIRNVTAEVMKESEKDLERGSVTFMSKIASMTQRFKESMSKAWDSAKSGDLVGAGKTATAGSYNAIGGAIDSGLEAAGDFVSKITGGAKKIQSMVYKAFRNAGLTDSQAKAITAEVGRENDYKASVIFGTHVDPAKDAKGNNIRNVGMLSWNQSRGAALTALLKSRGQIDGRGNMPQTQAVLNTQAEFAVSEMKGAYSKRLTNFWKNPNANPDSYAAELGKGYVVWAYGQDTIRAGGGKRKPFNWKQHDQKRKGYLNSIKVEGAETAATNGLGGKGIPVKPATGIGQATGASIMGKAQASLGSKTGAPQGMDLLGRPNANTPVKSITSTGGSGALMGAAGAIAGAAKARSIGTTSNNLPDWNFSKMAKTLEANAEDVSKGKCALYVRKGLQAGDVKGKVKSLGGTLGHAFEFMTSLPKLGFNKVFSGTSLNGFTPLIGDVAVFDRGTYGAENKSGGGWKYGHVAAFIGGKWVSDFIQRTVFPSSKLATAGVPFSIFRANGIAPQGGFDAAEGREEGEATPFQTTGQQVTKITDVSQRITNVSNGAASPTGVPAGGAINPSVQQPAPLSGDSVESLLTKSLNTQLEMLDVLKVIAGIPSPASKKVTQPRDNGMNNPNSGADQSSVTMPNLGAATPQRSPFEGIPNPVRVTKPS